MYIRQIDLVRRQQEAARAMERQRDGEAGVTVTEMMDVPQFKIGSFSIKVDFEEADEFFKEKARNELRETPEVIQQALKDIRLLLKGEPELNIPDEDEFYRKFLRPCKWYPKSAFELMKRFYQFKLNNPRYSTNLTPSNEKRVLNSEIVIPLPDRTEEGCRLLLINAGTNWNSKIISSDEIFRSVMLCLDSAMAEPKTQIAGVHVILNMAGLTLSHLTHITPRFAAAVTEWVQRCLPFRLKGIHVVNQPFLFNMVFAIFKPFLMEKTRKRLHFHGTNRNTLISFVGTKNLPIEFGGELEMPSEPIGQGIYDYFCWFEQNFEASNKYGYVTSTK